MRITGQRKLQKQLKQVAANCREEVTKTTNRSAKRYANFARKVAPAGATGETKNVINWQSVENDKGVFGFVNFARPTKESAVRQAAISYGRSQGVRGSTFGYEYIQTTKKFIGDKFLRSLARAIRQGVKRSHG